MLSRAKNLQTTILGSLQQIVLVCLIFATSTRLQLKV